LHIQFVDGNACGFATAEAEAVVTQADFHRVAKRGETKDFDFFAFEQTHFQQALHNAIVAGNGRDGAALAAL
jgi:hypothetical protein